MSREFVARWRSVGADKVERDFRDVGRSAKTADRALDGINDTGTRTKRRMEEVSLGLKDLAKGFLAFQGVSFLKDAITEAADFETGLNSLNQVVGETATEEIQDWSRDNADALNLSQSATLDAANAFSVYARAIDEAGGDAVDFTTDMTTLAAELAALKGANPGEVIDALGAALRGEYDPLERFGIALNAAAVNAKAVELGLAASTSEVSQAAKIQATYNLLMEQGAFAIGSIESQSGTFAGTVADLRAKVEDLTLELGQSLLPAATAVAGVLGTLIDGFSDLPDPIQTGLVALSGFAVVNKLFGSQIGSIGKSLKEAGGGFRTFFASMARVQTLEVVEVGIGGVTKNLGPMTTSLTRAERAASGLSTAFGGVRSAVSKSLSLFGGPWVVGITAVATGFLAASQNAAAFERKVQDLTESMADLSEAARAKALADFFEGEALSIPTRVFTDLDDYADALAETGLQYGDIENAVYDLTDAEYERFRQALQQKALEATTTQQKDGYEAVLSVVDRLRTAELNRRDVIDQVAASTDGLSVAEQEAAAAMEEVAEQADSARDALDELIDSFTVLNSKLGVRNSLYEYKEDLRGLSDELSSGQLTFSPDSEAGKENWDALVQAAETADSRIQAILAEEGPAAAAAAWDQARGEILQTLIDAGVEAGVAEGLLNQVFGKEYKIDASLDTIGITETEAEITGAIERLQGKVTEIEEQEVAIEADVNIPQQAKNVLLEDLAAEKATINARIGNKQEIVNELKGLSPEQRIQVGAELVENGGNVRKALREVVGEDWNTKIDVGAKNLDKTEGQIQDVADGPYEADIDVSAVGVSVAKSQILDAAEDQYTTIWVTRRNTGGSGADNDGGGATRAATLSQLATLAAGMERNVQSTYPAQPFYKGEPPLRAPAAQSSVTEIQPRRNAVKVYLDGAEIASHLDLQADRLVAATTRRTA